MKASMAFALSIFAASSALAVQGSKVKITLAPKVGVTKYKFGIVTALNGQDVHVDSTLEQDIKSIESDLAKVSYGWKDLKITLGSGEQDVPSTNIEVQYAPSTGLIKTASGGIDGTDEQRVYVLLHFLAPKGEITEGESYTVDVKESKVDDVVVPAYKYESKFLGKADVAGKGAYKFTAKYSEAGKDSMEAVTTFFVTEDGMILKADSEFKKMPLPKFGTTIDGKMSVSLSK